jgi:endonuclease/exonuclease/phosphatase family metal-dependent hydrolase
MIAVAVGCVSMSLGAFAVGVRSALWAPLSAMDNVVPARLHASPSSFALMTFNIRYGTASDGRNSWSNRRDAAMEVIRRNNPDIIGLQEALGFQLDQLVTGLGGYVRIGAGRDDGKEAGEHAAILFRSERFALVKSGTFWLSKTPDVPGSRSWGSHSPRICTWAKLHDRKTGRGILCYNVHLDPLWPQAREKGIALVVRHIASQDGALPVVITGDFNSGERSRAIRLLKGECRDNDCPALPMHFFTDTFRTVHPLARQVGTFNFFYGINAGPKIDFILSSPGIDVCDARIVRDVINDHYPSDHYPVFARVQYAKAPTAHS